MTKTAKPVYVYVNGRKYSGVLRDDGSIAFVTNGQTRYAASTGSMAVRFEYV